LVPHTEDGRVIFAVPWQERLLVGTTDDEVDVAKVRALVALRGRLDPFALATRIEQKLERVYALASSRRTQVGRTSGGADAAAQTAPAPTQNQTSEFQRWYQSQPRVPLIVPADGAKVLVVKFNDFQCPPCRNSHCDDKPQLRFDVPGCHAPARGTRLRAMHGRPRVLVRTQ
jgi:hypothetical protein